MADHEEVRAVGGFDPEDDEWDFADHDGYCTHCGGDGYDECDDPIQCTSAHTRGDLCPCGACGGSGLAKDQRIW
jgi:hypothetical protein